MAGPAPRRLGARAGEAEEEDEDKDDDEDEEERVGLLAGGGGGRAGGAPGGGNGGGSGGTSGPGGGGGADAGARLPARLLAAWRRPLAAGSARAPGWLKGRVVCAAEEEESLAQLRHLASVAYDAGEPKHERELRRLYAAVRSPQEARELGAGKDARWKELGFQAEDPRTDFRGGGLLALQNMCYLAEAFPDETAGMLREASGCSGGRGAPAAAPASRGEYLFAAACVNVSAMLVLLLGLNAGPAMSPVRAMPCPAHAAARKHFAARAALRDKDAEAQGGSGLSAREVLGELFSSSVMKLHAEWRAVCARKPDATLLDFGEALGGTAVAMERLLGAGLPPSSSSPPSASQPLALALFSALGKIDSGNWRTTCLNRLARARSAALEAACRACAVLAELLDGLGVPRLWAACSFQDKL